MAESKEDFTDVITARDAFDKANTELEAFEQTHFTLLRSTGPEQASAMEHRNALFNQAGNACDELGAALTKHGLIVLVMRTSSF
jgi:hypothetical protein